MMTLGEAAQDYGPKDFSPILQTELSYHIEMQCGSEYFDTDTDESISVF